MALAERVEALPTGPGVYLFKSRSGRLRLAVEATSIGGDGPGYTVSIGVAEDPETNLDGLIQKADTALYQAKRGGRNRVEALGPDTVVESRNLSPTAA